MANENSKSGGIGFTGLLFITFLVLKLTHVIDWSWWWITAPLWIPFGLAILAVIACAIILGGAGFRDALKKRVRRGMGR